MKYFWQNLQRNFEIKDIFGKTMKAMDIYSISIKYFKDSLNHQLKLMTDTEGFLEDRVTFVFTIPTVLGVEAQPFLREAAIKVSCISHHA